MINSEYLFKFESPHLRKVSNKKLEELYRQVHEAYKEWQDEMNGEDNSEEAEEIATRSIVEDQNPELLRQVAVLKEQVSSLLQTRVTTKQIQRDENGQIIGLIERTE